jgi:hypothetical protein
MQTPEKFIVNLTLDEANLVLTALANLPYVQVHSLISNLQSQVAPQLSEIAKKDNGSVNGKISQMAVS